MVLSNKMGWYVHKIYRNKGYKDLILKGEERRRSSYRKIPKISPRAYIFEGLIFEGNWRFKIDWASLIAGRNFTVFALFYFVFEGNFQVQAPWGGGGVIFGGAI